ncbi:Hypothetical predicted protein [Pelobates cultripes]|uniref:Uncharacterized protein n=1 Tax=Pelobates cultripes TaxID=61616 RepID=A0AAD1RY96_PELCU|nr:Hypothetical predicted protein [Pelobates cultripes]
MQSDKDQTFSSGSQVTPQISQGNLGEGTMSPDLSATADMQALFDVLVSRSISQAMVSAMGTVSTFLSHSITQAILQAHQSVQQAGTSTASSVTTVPHGHKAKTKHSSKTALSDSLKSVSDYAQPPPRKRATSRAKSARLWKRARAQLDSSGSELSDIEEEMDESNKDDLESQSESDSDGALGEDSASSFGTFPVTLSG